MATAPRDPGSQQFTTEFDTGRLIEVVRVVARHANPEDPESAAPEAYAAARAPAGFPDAPGVRATRRALGNLGWYELLHLVFHEQRSIEHNIAIAERDDGRATSEQEAVAALRIIAKRLEVQTLRPHEYDAALQSLGPQQVKTGLPNSARIEAALKTGTEMGWDRGLRLAGLHPRAARGGERGVDALDAVRGFLVDVGCLPWGRVPLQQWAKLRGVALHSFDAPAVADAVEAIRAERHAARVWTPDEPPRRGRRPSLDASVFTDRPVDVARRVPRHGADSWAENPERIIEGLVLAYDEAARRRLRLTQKVHRRLATEFPGAIPAPAVVDRTAKRHGTTAAAWREEAKRRRIRL